MVRLNNPDTVNIKANIGEHECSYTIDKATLEKKNIWLSTNGDVHILSLSIYSYKHVGREICNDSHVVFSQWIDSCLSLTTRVFGVAYQKSHTEDEDGMENTK